MSVIQKHKNKKFIMFATGPSLTQEVVDTIRPYKDKFVMFGINDAYRAVDYLDEHYACDEKWWTTHGDDFRKKYPNLSSWTGHAVGAASKYNLQFVKGKHANGFSLDSKLIHYGQNSGYQALNVALLMGGCKFLLVGYNMKAVGKKKHFFGDHPAGLNKNSPYQSFIRNYETIQPGIKNLIINCTPNSALTCFETADLKEALENESSSLLHN